MLPLLGGLLAKFCADLSMQVNALNLTLSPDIRTPFLVNYVVIFLIARKCVLKMSNAMQPDSFQDNFFKNVL